MKKSKVESKALPVLQRVPKDRIELAARYFAMSNMATLDVQRIKIVDLKTMQRAVDAAWEVAVVGTMEGMNDTFEGKTEIYDRNESKAMDMVEKEIKHWRKLIKSNDRYCLETLNKEFSFLFEEPKIYIARANGTREILDHVPTLEEAQKVVGGYVERVCPRYAPDVIFLCNEEGHIKNLPINQHGTEMYKAAPIAGDIIVIPRKLGRKWL